MLSYLLPALFTPPLPLLAPGTNTNTNSLSNTHRISHANFFYQGWELLKLCSSISPSIVVSMWQKYLLINLLITFIFDRCHCSWAAVAPVKYECDIQCIMCALTMLRNWENNWMDKIDFVTPTPGVFSWGYLFNSIGGYSSRTSQYLRAFSLHCPVLVGILPELPSISGHCPWTA